MDAALEFDTGTKTPAELTEALESLPDALTDELEAAGEDIGVRIRGAAQGNAPVDRGRLRASLSSLVETVGATLVRIQVGSNVDQAAPMEHGTDPFFPPPSELRGWAGRVLGDEDLAWPVAQSIAETGIEAQPYLGPAFEDNVAWAVDRINTAVENAFAEVGLA